MSALMGRWAPPMETTVISSTISTGLQLGTVLTLPLSGILCKYGFDGGWPSVFYLFGSVSLIWFIFYCFLVYDDPASHPRISREERIYIERSIGTGIEKYGEQTIPWRRILTSRPVWALNAGYFGYMWGSYTLATCLPLYMKEILRYDLTENGFISALPYCIAGVSTFALGFIVDKIRQKGHIPTVVIRKFVATSGLLISAVTLIAVGYVGCDRLLAVVILCVCFSGAGLIIAGITVNNLDLSPNYASILMAISNTIGTVAGMLAPVVVGAVTNEQPTRERWLIVFYIAAAVLSSGALIFLLFGSADRQPWDRADWLLDIDQSPFLTGENSQSQKERNDTITQPLISDPEASGLKTLPANNYGTLQ